MLEIVQAGQPGKQHLLTEMHRLRKRIFRDKMGWDVSCNADGLEMDEFDLPNTVYVLAIDEDRRVLGNWRLLPTSGPTMIRDVWPQFLDTLDMPSHPDVWECSRFAVEGFDGNKFEGLAHSNRATKELFLGVAELCYLCGIEELYALYDWRIGRILTRLKCHARAYSSLVEIDGSPAQVGAFVIGEQMLQALRTSTGIKTPLVTLNMVPPVLLQRAKVLNEQPEREAIYAAG